MPIARHTAPIHPGEDILSPPKADDPRVKPWMDHLQELGVMDSAGKALKPMTLRRGVGPSGYLWEVEWVEENAKGDAPL